MVYTGERKAGRRYAAGLLILLVLAGCGTTPPATTALPGAVVDQATAPSSPTPAAPPQPIVMATAAPPPSPTSIQTSTPVTGPSPAAPDAATSSPTPTAPPTFTPPPPPPPVAGEKLWLPRPVPSSGATWTDKTYPYGSTRGGLLRPHTGVEFGVPAGTPVLATAAGTVVVAGNDATVAYGPQTVFYGNLVIIELTGQATDSSVFTLYGHLSEVGVTVGQVVTAGDVIGLSGATGVADGPHLHFEVRVGQNSYDSTRNPLLWLVPLRETGVVAGRITGLGGELLQEAPLTLVRVDAPAPYAATTSYAAGEPNSDGTLGENFAVDDVVPGFYQAIVDTGNRRFTADLWVYSGRVNWVEIVVGP